MWCVEPPEEDAGDTFDTCISKVKNKNLKARLVAARQTIVDESADYAVYANDGELHFVEQSETVNETVTANEMVSVYTS